MQEKYAKMQVQATASIEAYAERLFSDTHLGQACIYSLIPPGKCFRSVLVLAAGELLDVPSEQLEPYAVAVEFVHVGTLIHDDLPAIDDDDLRRGRASCHVRFGEATALLAGDRLLLEAQHLLASAEHVDSETRLRQIELLSGTVLALCEGQMLDLIASGQVPIENPVSIEPKEELRKRHSKKTAALIRASVLGATAFLDPYDAKEAAGSLSLYGNSLGLLFQITDDLLEATSNTEALGKDVGSDERRGTPTYVSVYGLESAQEVATEIAEQALAALDPFAEKAEFFTVACVLCPQAN